MRLRTHLTCSNIRVCSTASQSLFGIVRRSSRAYRYVEACWIIQTDGFFSDIGRVLVERVCLKVVLPQMEDHRDSETVTFPRTVALTMEKISSLTIHCAPLERVRTGSSFPVRVQTDGNRQRRFQLS